ncbi:unnamed protein product [Phytophthora lilii]|uniref:Unnamed protein product n=1 Tax=Phytophthora lilii TaxID=2077276 RepID=A0A9W6XJS3_9STRA|nr:unnamed protein product [Phytophthora lilii]
MQRNPSILVGGEDYLDDDDWDEHAKPRRRSSSVEVALGSCFASLSSGLRGARTALTARANELYTRGSTGRGGQLRNSMAEVSSMQAGRRLARANSMPAPYRSSDSDLDLFSEEEDEPGAEDATGACLSKTETPSRESSPRRSRLVRLLSTRSWTQGSK